MCTHYSRETSSTGDAMFHPRLRGKRKRDSIWQNRLRAHEKSGQVVTGLSLSMAKSEKEKLSITSDMDVDTDKTSSTGHAVFHPRIRGKRKQSSIWQNRLSKSREKSRQAVTELSLSMAKSEKEKLSLTSDTDVDIDRTCEVEVSYEGEADLHKHLNSCKKNPGHQNFVPVDQFSIEHLPSDYRNNDLLDLIRAMSDLTVRLSTTYVSDKRPKTWPDSNEPYPFCNGSHRSAMRTGTGWVCDIEKYSDQSRCSRCNGSSSPNIKHVMVCIQTGAHVVFDEQEGQHTTCHFFFDKGGTPDLCPGVVALTEISSTQSNTKEDWCHMWYVTCDLDLIDKLVEKRELYKYLENELSFWLRDSLRERVGESSYSAVCSEKLLCVIVSHPHGCSKQVSVGYCKSRTTCKNSSIYNSTRLTYTTPTCPGSSGAPIFLLGDYYEDHLHVHHGVCEEDKELNRSSEGKDSVYGLAHYPKTRTSDITGKACRLCFGDNVAVPTLLQLPVDTEGQGPWDVEVSYGGETELHQRYNTCEKNPGHQKFIPVDQLNMNHLPSHIKHPEWLDLIRALSDLTVRVSVKSVSDKRPKDLKFLKTFSSDEQPDPCYRDSTRNMMLTGTGCMVKVIKYENSDEYRTCSCKECQMSQTPKTEFAQIYIRTTVQVVYDKFEAEHSTCDFFFDRGHTPDTCPGAVTLSGVSVPDFVGFKDLQYLICVTHDLGLVDRLIDLINKYESLFKIITKTIKNSSEMTYFRPIGFVVGVSHPHGCSKQVSVGYQHFELGPYTTQTCPGSTGAHFLALVECFLSYCVHIGNCELRRYRSHGTPWEILT